MIFLVGSDGTLGRNLFSFFKTRGISVAGTTRDRNRIHEKEKIFFDLRNVNSLVFPKSLECAVLLAAVTDIRVCEDDECTDAINTDNVSLLAERLLRAGVFTVFISSGVVFGGEREFPEEYERHDPRFRYARQKSAAEQRIRAVASDLGKEHLYAIVRITRTVDIAAAPISYWLQSWQGGKAATPFSDLYFSPITVDYAVDGIARVVSGKCHGCFNLSGAANESYAAFCRRLAEGMKIPAALVNPVSYRDSGKRVLHQVRCGALGMGETSKRLGIRPQPLEETVESLIQDGANFDWSEKNANE